MHAIPSILTSLSGAASSPDLAEWLIDTSVKSSVLLAATALAAWLLRRRSAALIHRVWTLGFCGCLVIPVATYIAPLGTLPILPHLSTIVGSAASPAANGLTPPTTFPAGADPLAFAASPVAGQTPPAGHHSSVATGKPALQPTASTVATATIPLAPASAPLKPQSRTSAESISWPRLLLTLWLAGMAACLARTGWQIWMLQRVLRRSTRTTSEVWTAAVADAADSLGLRRRIHVAIVPGARVPAVTGIWRTLLLLPADAEAWSPERRRLVLLHELGHAQRRDVLAQELARLVCAVHWFNPLSWLGLIQMGKLRELACDDLVLSSGQAPADYADVLLDVARSCCHRPLGLAVGMARRANVEDRILAILDRARNRMSLSPRAARRWALGTIAIVALLGSLRLSTSAEPPTETATKKGEPTKPATGDGDLRTMIVRITDEAGKPLEKARLHVSVWEFDGQRNFPNRDFFTNADGNIDVTLPKRLMILRMWPAKPGYVPEFINFGEGTHDEGRLLPDRYEFQLAKGSELGGMVVDQDGKPISGVQVAVSVDVREPAWTTKPDPMISKWLNDTDFAEGPVVTNSEGRWSISNAPAPTAGDPYVFQLKHTHPNYSGDTRWAELQEQQKVTTAMLRDGTAKIVLPRGVTVNGSVVDQAGRPVTRGFVFWHDDPYRADRPRHTPVGDDGRFATTPLSPGKYVMSVIAPGFSPTLQKLEVKTGMDDLRFQLPSGNRVVIKIVDDKGQPIPHAGVVPMSWRDNEAIYNQQSFSELPDTEVPLNADADGIYTWDWAPEDAVLYIVNARGYGGQEITLTATAAENVIELSRTLVAAGRVTDRQTGSPIEAFRVIPVTEFRPQFLATQQTQAVPGKNGQYQLTLDEFPKPSNRYRVRVEAPGYRSAMCEQSFAAWDGEIKVDFELEPAAMHMGHVLGTDGQPLAGASIVVGTPSVLPMMRDGALEWGKDAKTTSDGSFELNATFEPMRIRALHATGIAEVLRQPDDEIGTLRLQPWARLSGRLLQDGQPVPDQMLIFDPSAVRGITEARLQDAYRAQTDPTGRFEFTRVPPGIGSVRAYLGPWQESPLTSSESVPVDLQPGEHQELVLGGNGVTVTGQVNATGRGNVELNKNWSLNYLIRRDVPQKLPPDFPAIGFDPAAPIESAWFLDPNIYSWLATRPNYFVKLSPDGRFRIHGVPPGQYDLVLRLYEQPAGCLVETIGTRIVPIEVTATDSATGTKDAGAIDVACRIGPRIGENMQAYKVLDRTGQQRTIQELNGEHVVLHVWASWCAPCVQHMSEIQSSVAEWQGRPITVVGLNLDADRQQAQALVATKHWDWAQMYLGDDSDMSRQLAISTVPTYYLIGPDGNLITSASEWSQIRQSLESAK